MTELPVIGLLHPGEMGAAVGSCLVQRGCRVLWASASRSPQTVSRAAAAGLTDASDMTALAEQAEVIISVCPPHAALDVARSAIGFSGLYIDANAISPQSASEVAGQVEAGGARYVDGGIIGPPPLTRGSTRLYLSGEDAGQVRDLFDGTALDARVIQGEPFSASAVKLAYAAWTKGSAALLLAARAFAAAQGVSDALLAEWELSQPGLDGRSHAAASSAVSKSWRWTGEMEQIASAMSAAGLPGEFHLAAAEIYRRSAKAGPGDDAIGQVLAALRDSG